MSHPQQHHVNFSVDCFNEVWGLLEKQGRTQAENRLMREMAHASLYHWLSREDCTDRNISIGLWQISRVYAVLGDANQARTYAEECIELSNKSELPAFYRGYAYEAAARAAKAMGDPERAAGFLNTASALSETIQDEEERRMLDADLAELNAFLSS